MCVANQRSVEHAGFDHSPRRGIQVTRRGFSRGKQSAEHSLVVLNNISFLTVRYGRGWVRAERAIRPSSAFRGVRRVYGIFILPTPSLTSPLRGSA